MDLLRFRRERTTSRNRRETEEKTRKNRMVVLRKRQVAAASLILLIGVAGYLNMSIQNGETDPNVSVMYTEASKRLGEAKMVNATEPAQNEQEDAGKNNTTAIGADYFTNAKMEREKTRGETIEMLTGVLNATGADKEAKDNAQQQIEMLAKFTEGEVAAENMIRAKGYGDCIVFMGENVTSVAVETNGLNEIDAAVITELVANSGAVRADQVKIVEIKPN